MDRKTEPVSTCGTLALECGGSRGNSLLVLWLRAGNVDHPREPLASLLPTCVISGIALQGSYLFAMLLAASQRDGPKPGQMLAHMRARRQVPSDVCLALPCPALFHTHCFPHAA